MNQNLSANELRVLTLSPQIMKMIRTSLEELIHFGSIELRLKEQRSENIVEQALETLQEMANPKDDIEQEVIIPPTDSIQWSNITIRKKGKKKSYKFWQTPSNGKDMLH